MKNGVKIIQAAAFNGVRMVFYSLIKTDLILFFVFMQLGQSPDLIHASGHSLGAHLVGHIGRAVEKSTGSKIARVTGEYVQV